MKHLLVFLAGLLVAISSATAQTGSFSRDTSGVGIAIGNTKTADLNDGNLYVTKRTGASTKTVSTLTVGMKRWQMRGITGPAPTRITFTDRTLGGDFYYDATDTSTPDDGVLTITDLANHRYKRVIDGPLPVTKAGVVLGAGISAAQRTANNTALNLLFNSGIESRLPEGVIEKTGSVSAVNVALKVSGTGRGSIIRQMDDNNALIIDNSAGNYYPTLTNFRIEAGGSFTSAVGLTVTGFPSQTGAGAYFYQKQTGYFEGLEIIGSDAWTTASPVNQFKKGILVNTPNMMVFRDMLVQGATSFSTMLTANTTGFEFNAPRASVETVLDNCRAVGVTTGFYGHCANNPGLEGIRFKHCSAITVEDGFVLTSDAYLAPLWVIDDCHTAAYRFPISLVNASQPTISNNTLYNFGNSNSGDYAAFMNLKQIAYGHIHDNNLVAQGFTGTGDMTNDPYGIISAGFGSNLSSFNVFHDNLITLKSGANKPGIWLQSAHEYTRAHDNVLLGGSGISVLSDNASSSNTNNLTSNYPLQTKTFSTSAWSVGSYNELIAPGTLLAGRAYQLTLFYSQPGTDEVQQVFSIIVSTTSTGATVAGNIPNSGTSYTGTGRAINLRYKPGTGTYGIEGTINTSGMSGTLIMTINPQ